MGNLTQALKLITEKLQDVNQAIQFCMEQADEELWENLIEYAMGNPSNYRMFQMSYNFKMFVSIII